VFGPAPLYPQDRPRPRRDGASHRPPSLVRIHTVSPLRITSDKGATVLMRWGTQAYTVILPRWSGAAHGRGAGRVVVEQLTAVDRADVLQELALQDGRRLAGGRGEPVSHLMWRNWWRFLICTGEDVVSCAQPADLFSEP
jgi:hypothetical protein